MITNALAAITSAFLAFQAIAAEPAIPPTPDKQPEPPFPLSKGAAPQMLLPGFTVRELPVQITSINNVEYAADGRLFAGGYDGRFHLLRDSDGDGLEDQVTTFSAEPTANYPLGMAVKDGSPYAVLTDQVVRFVDTDGDGLPEKRETVVKGFDDPALQKLKFINHRRVDSSLALALGPDGAIYVTMGNAGYNNPYWQDAFSKDKGPAGTPHYTSQQRRGCLLRLTPDGKVEQLASGLRYIMSLQFNAHGDLFGTDQEGATWCPNGNPFDELLHIQPGRHYGFPPSHPKFLPDAIDEPSVFDYGPQHQSTCGFRFNGPAAGHGRFGPEFWREDAIVTGESRGRLWRTKLAKTAAGYVAKTELIARTGLLPVDCAISPKGDLLVSCHTGTPDWGNGPKGQGRLFKISYTEAATPQPVAAWPRSDTQTVVAFDRPLDEATWRDVAGRIRMEAGRYVDAADRLETIRPGYAVVHMQQRQQRSPIAVESTQLSEGGRNLIIKTAPRVSAVNYALTLPGGIDLAHDLSGVWATWSTVNGSSSNGKWADWLPHPDLAAARAFTASSSVHDALWKRLEQQGELTLRGALDLSNMLVPATQPGSKLDYEPAPETVTVSFKSDAALHLVASVGKVEQIATSESRLTVIAPRPGEWPVFTLTVTTPAKSLDVAFFTDRDPRPRAMPTRRFLMPFAKPAPPDDLTRKIPQITGGSWEAGRALFNGKAACATCHQLRGQGFKVGPELGNLVHRDYASVLKDIADPNATINPDAVAYTVSLTDGTAVVGTRLGESESELQIAQPGGAVAKVSKSRIAKTEPLPVSLMPPGLEKILSAEELRDLMTYLLTEAPAKKE